MNRPAIKMTDACVTATRSGSREITVAGGMRLRLVKEAWLIFLVLEVVTLTIGASGADLAISSHFYRSGAWPV